MLKRLLFFVLGFTTLNQWVWAQKGDSLKSVKSNLVEILVRKYQVSDYFSTSLMTRKEFQQRFVGQDLFQSINRLPGVVTYSDAGNNFGNYFYLRLRGMDFTRMAVNFNGVPLNDMVSQGTFFSNMADFGTSLGSIQLLRGISTTAFGTASFAGTLNLSGPWENRPEYNGSVNIQAGSYGTYRLNAEAFTPVFGKGFDAYVRVSHLRSDGFRNNSGSKASSVFGSLRWTSEPVGDFTRHQLIATAFTGQTRNQLAYLPSAETALNQNIKDNPLTPTDDHDLSTQSLYQLEYKSQLNRTTSLRASYYHQLATSDFDATFIDFSGNFPYIYKLKNEMQGGYVVFNKIISTFALPIQTELGLNAYRFVRNNSLVMEPDINTNLYDNKTTKTEQNLHAKFWTPTRLSLMVDYQFRNVRMDIIPDADSLTTFNEQVFVINNFKTGVTYDLTPNTKLFASLGFLTREPTREDMLNGNDNPGQGSIAANGNLNRVKPESVTDFEAGIKHNNHLFNVSLNYFNMRFKNELALTGERSANGFFALRENVAASRRQGIEWELLAKPLGQAIEISAGGAFTQAIIDEFTSPIDGINRKDVQALLTPKWIMNHGLAYKFQDIPLMIGVDHRLQSSAHLANDNNQATQIAGYHLWDARTEYRFRFGEDSKTALKIGFRAFNLFSARYFNAGQASFDGTNYQRLLFANAPRNFMANLTLEF